MKHGGFFSFSKRCQCRYNKIFIYIAGDLRLDEHTAQMYVSSDIASSGHVTHKGGHIKDRLASTFNQSRESPPRIVPEHGHQMNAPCPG